MKKIVFGILVSILMIGSVIASASIVEFQKNENNFSEISVAIPIGDYKIEEKNNGDELHLEDFGLLNIPGKPDLPSKIFSIAIPPETEYKDISYDMGEGIIIDGNFDISPVTLPRVIGVEKPEIYNQELAKYNKNYDETYSSDKSYPSSNVEFVRTAGFRKYNLVDVRVSPFTYKPISKELTYYPDITVTISYAYPDDYSPENIMIDNIEEAEKKAEQIILNYDQAKDWYPTGKGGRENYDYVIITLESLESSISDLVDWEESKGRSVYVATTEWITDNFNGYDEAEEIRNFLREKYPSDQWGILDVCLIGDYDNVPIRTTEQYVYGYGPPATDYYYAELSLPDSASWDENGNHLYGENSDPIDFYTEINVGRIPWSDPETVEHICEKSVAYEENDDPSFKKNILLLGAFFWDYPDPRTDNAVLMETKTNPEEHPWMEDWTMTRLYEEGYSDYDMDYDLTYDNVKTVWSEGSYGFVNWAGHGSPYTAARYHPSTKFVDTGTCNYLNDDYPAIVFADACSNSDTRYDNIGKMMLKQGAVGFLGATCVAFGCSGWDDPMDGSSQSLDYFFTTCCTSGDYTQGEAQQYGLLEMYTNNLWYFTYYEMFQWGALWGNPGLTMGEIIFSDPPATPDAPDGPSEWIINLEATFSAVTTEPDGEDVYYMFNWGDGEQTDWLGPYPSGQTVEASHTWSELGDYEITVIAKDTWGSQSEWSEPKLLSIVEDKAPDAPDITGPNVGTGGREYDFTFTATDPDGHNVYYLVDWDDGEKTEWLGPYSSGETMVLSHTWNHKGEYFIKAWAKDFCEKQSEQGNHRIIVLKSKTRIQTFADILARILLTRPILGRILNLR